MKMKVQSEDKAVGWLVDGVVEQDEGGGVGKLRDRLEGREPTCDGRRRQHYASARSSTDTDLVNLPWRG